MADRVRIYEVGPRDGLQNEATPIALETKLALHRAPRRRRPARDRGDELRRRRRRSPSWPTPTSCSRGCRATTGVRYPVLVPNERGMDRAEAAGARRARRLHRRDRRLHRAEHRDDRRRVARGLRAGAPAGRRARLVAPRLRLDRLRLPVHRRRRPASGRRGRDAAPRARRRRGLLRRHDRRRRAEPGRGAHGRGRPGGIPLERIAYHFHDTRGTALANVAGRPRRRRPLLRQLDRRHGRLSRTRPAPPATSPPRTSSTCSTPRATSTASTSRASSRRPGSSPARSGKPLASKVGQAGGWDRRDRRADRPDRRSSVMRGPLLASAPR